MRWFPRVRLPSTNQVRACRSQVQNDDLWDFGTVRNVQARPATLRKNAAAAAAAQQSAPLHSDRELPPPPSPGVRAHDYATTSPSPPSPHARPARTGGPDQPAFETVRRSIVGPPPSAHSEYSDYSSSPSVPSEQRPRVELDREKERIERERLVGLQLEQHQRAQVSRPDSWASSEEGERREEERTPTRERTASEEDEDGGSILETVVLPVLDSVSRFRLVRARTVELMGAGWVDSQPRYEPCCPDEHPETSSSDRAG